MKFRERSGPFGTISAERCVAFLFGAGLLLVGASGSAGALPIFATNVSGSSVLAWESATGGFLGTFVPSGGGGLKRPSGLAFGPDGDLFVAQMGNKTTPSLVKRYDGTTGAYLGVYSDLSGESDDSNDLITSIRFGPDGNLYAFDNGGVKKTHKVFRFEGPLGTNPGAQIDEYATTLDWGRPDRRLRADGMTFNADDGDLYLVDQALHGTIKVQGPFGADPGACIDSVASAFANKEGCSIATTEQLLDGGLVGGSTPRAIAFGPDGDMYISTGQGWDHYLGLVLKGEERILRYRLDGTFVEVFVPSGILGYAGDLAFGPDGNLYVAEGKSGAGKILVFGGPLSATPGELLSTLTPPAGKSYTIRYLTFGPETLSAPDSLLFASLSGAPLEATSSQRSGLAAVAEPGVAFGFVAAALLLVAARAGHGGRTFRLARGR
jgi:hypothetical protein